MWCSVKKREWEMATGEAPNKYPLQEAFLKPLYFLKKQIEQFDYSE